MLKKDRSRKTKDPCSGCGLHKERCICKSIPELNLKTKLSLIIHTSELKRTTNTGMLAAKALKNSEVIVRGLIDQPLDFAAILNPDYENLLFYPSENAVELNAELASKFEKPVNLLVPDGSWRQAGKVHYRHKEISHLPRVMIKKVNTAVHHLRAEHNQFGMSTLEAIAWAFGALEGPEVQGKLLKLYQEKLAATLEGRPINQPKNVRGN